MQIPRIILVLVAIPRLFEVLKRPAYSVPANGMYWSKILISVILAALASIELVDHLFLNSSAPLYRHDVLVSATGIAAFAFAAVMHHIEHFRSSVGSTALLFFWLFSIVAEAIRLRTLFLDGKREMTRVVNHAPHIELAINAAAIVLTIAVFVLENLPKPRPYYSSLPTSDTDTSCDEQKCPELYANIFSRLTFHWMDPLMKLGASKDLEMDDLWNLKPSDTALVNSGTFSKQWNEQLLKKKPSLLAVCLKVYGPMFLSTAVFKACQDLCSFIQPTFLRQMMEFADSWSRENRGHEQPISRGFAIALCMLATAITQTLFLHQYFHICIVTGMRLKTAVITAVYKKALKLSSSSRQSSTVGEIVNLMAVDASRLGDLTTYLHILWSGPFQISLALYFLYQALGPSVFAGVAVMLVMIPINAVLATKSRDLNKVQMKNKDGRTKLMDEILNGIKVIKLYAWEIPFAGKVNEVRERELATLKNIGYLSATQSFTWACTPFLVSFLTFATYSLVSNEPLTSTKVFVSLALFNLLQFPLTVFPNVITSVIDASVSFNRLYTFLMNEELDPSSVVHEYRAHAAATTDGSSVERISIKSGTFRWSKNSTEPVLKDISISVHDGSLVTLVGQVGSGKTSILSAILGEMYKSSGEVVVRGSIAYVSQTAWIMNSTLRENITFGKRFDPVFYEATISACGLKPDLEMLPAGDMTEIGEKGINFGRHIFEKVIGPRGLLRDKAKLFVTHSIHFLPEVDVVHLLQNGSIVESGGYEEVMGRGKLIFNLMKEYGKRKEDTEEAFEDAPSRAPSQGQTPAKSMSRAGSKDMLPTKDAAAVPAAPRGNLMTKEESAKGSVSWSVYSSYAESCSFRNVIAYLAVAVMSQMLSISQNLYLADWADANDKRQNKFLRGLLSGEDMYTVDEVLPRTFQTYFRTLFNVLSVLVVNAIGNWVYILLVGLALTYSLNVTQSLNWMVRQSCEIETNIVAVERIKEYVELPQEAPYQIPNAVSSPGWPEHGVIEFKNYSTRYREGLDLVLNNISFAVKPNEKIGIVGRTGAGKSSLTLALFRIIEAVDGEIVIDSKDISKMGLYDLRSRMTIIPQDAFLFTGTVRDNIDPFRTASDSDLWAALEASNLKDVIARLEGKLDAPVFQNGENFSTGQRQLICLARAVMRKSKILVLDEATAAIDYETDAQIQKTIRELAQHSTVVTIAHRINTIIDYDRILVLDAGRVAELDTPEKLLSNRHSKFFALAKEAGLVK
ncbi:hypothetical protein HK101_008174 [Irineochytrium annulatum]|nr:hypothetical protein HK101_008174 [Irineochytrium annulatum]